MALKRIILHVGTGKTGSSSIQRALAKSQENLELQGYAFLGRMLETYQNEQSLPIESWQANADHGELLSLGSKGMQAYIDRLNQQLDQLDKRNIHTAIMSNEGWSHRAALMQPVINAMVERDLAVEIIAVVRRHYEWAFSAYLQWGIRHKIIPGRILRFGEWIQKRPPRFANSLRAWRECKGIAKFQLLNYGAYPDIVPGFLEELGILIEGRDRSEDHSNPSATELEAIILATYADHQDGKTHPGPLKGILERLDQQSHVFRADAIQAWPGVTSDDLETLAKLCDTDIAATNQLLAESHQPELLSRAEQPLQIPSSISRHNLTPRRRQEELVAALLCIVADLDRQLREQERSIKLKEKD